MIGGHTNPPGADAKLKTASVECFDPVTDCWTACASLPRPMNVVAVAVGSDIWVIPYGDDEMLRYDPSADSYEPVSHHRVLAPLDRPTRQRLTITITLAAHPLPPLRLSLLSRSHIDGAWCRRQTLSSSSSSSHAVVTVVHSGRAAATPQLSLLRGDGAAASTATTTRRLSAECSGGGSGGGGGARGGGPGTGSVVVGGGVVVGVVGVVNISGSSGGGGGGSSSSSAASRHVAGKLFLGGGWH
jgi:hypothetical protein